MNHIDNLYNSIYKPKTAPSLTRLKPFTSRTTRPNSAAILGGAFGDEGKGRITDEIIAHFKSNHPLVINYRDNGGANAGHTVNTGTTTIALHQIGSAAAIKGAHVISGKGMVVHPQDYVWELDQLIHHFKKIPAKISIDSQTVLCLDTHRAFEAVLKQFSTGSQGSTNRGISPAYADILYRHPLRARDLLSKNWRQNFSTHYQFYHQLCLGFGTKLATIPVSRLDQKPTTVGTRATFLRRLETLRTRLKPHIIDTFPTLTQHWPSSTPFVFEKAQGLGIDPRWGVYPDITASDCSLSGIHASTEGIVDPTQISAKIAVIKATYTSSVGSRKLPTTMRPYLARQIRTDAHEFGTTTGRPRDIYHLDLVMLKYFREVSGYNYLAFTHLDIAYSTVPIKLCVGYTKNGVKVPYRPDQEYLHGITPIYLELPSWDGKALTNCTNTDQLPDSCLRYLNFVSSFLGVKPLLATVGPQRHQTIRWF